MYEYLLKLYLKLYDIKQYHLSINAENTQLDKAIEWIEFVLSMMKKQFIHDILNYSKKFESSQEDLIQLLKTIKRLKKGHEFENEINLIDSYLTNVELQNVKNGQCVSCDLGIWESCKLSKDNSVCLLHKNTICRIFPGQVYKLS